MRVRAIVLALVALIATGALASAQSQTGEIFGKATDQSGAVLPGVTVTLTSPILLQPQVAVTSESPYILLSNAGAKFCSPPSASVVTRKNAKQSHTPGDPRKAKASADDLLRDACSVC